MTARGRLDAADSCRSAVVEEHRAPHAFRSRARTVTFPVSPVLSAALPDLAAEIHGEILDAAARHARALVELLHGRFRAPLTDRCLVICLGLSLDALTPLMDTYGAALEIGHVMKLRAINQLELTDGLTLRDVHEIEFLLEAHRFLPARRPASTP